MGDVDRFQIVRQLGADAAGFLARDTSVKPARLVVLERATRSAPTAEDRARVVTRCRSLVGLEHPKVVPIREVIERDGEVLVVCDFVDGEWLSALMALDPRPPIEILLRVVLDVLEGVAALHDLRDDKGHPLRIVHGALSPDSVLVAEDGVAEIARPFGISLAKPDRFVAPELRRGEAPADVRADVYSAGAILREVLGTAPADAKWAEQLTDIAWRACSVDPENRWPSAAAMATTLRRVAGPKLASADDVSAYVRRYFGARMYGRRASLEPGDDRPPPSSGEPLSVRPADMVVVDPSSVPTMVEPRSVPPKPPGAAVARVTLVRKAVDLLEIPEPAIERASPNVGRVTQRGMAAIAPPIHVIEPPLAQKPVSLPPPDIIVPDVIEPIEAPPPAVARASGAPAASEPPSEAYRRRLPTFSTIEPPPPRTTAVQAMAIAAAMVTTFGVGWWLGRNYPPPSELPACVSATGPVIARVPPRPGEPPAPVAPLPATPAGPAAVTATSSAPGPGASVSTSAGGSSLTSSAPTAAGVTTSASPVSAMPTGITTTAAAPRPVATWTPPPAPRPAVDPTLAPSAPAPAATPRPTGPPPPPRPTGSAGYVPSEL